MSVKLIGARQMSKLLAKLFKRHDEIYVATAWGSNGPVADSLFKQAHKFRSVTFGLAFCQTDPDLVDRMVDVANSFVALSDQGDIPPEALLLFHRERSRGCRRKLELHKWWSRREH